MPIDGQQISNPEFDSELFLRSGCVFALGANDLLIGWGEWKRSSRPSAGSPACSLFTPDFYMTDENPWRMPTHFRVVNREFFTTHVLPKLTSEVNVDVTGDYQGFQWVEPRKEGFEQQVEIIRERFEAGRLEKAVPVVHAQAREIMTQDRLVRILAKMVSVPASLIPHGFWDFDEGEGLLGATPERLFSIEKNRRLATMALAGTRAKIDDARSLFEDPKERHEHQIVVDDLAAMLAPYGRVSVGETHVAELPTLFHLKTPIEVEVEHVDFETLARALHPTPALGLAPRSYGFENMREWDEAESRVRYGAPFGILLRTGDLAIQDCLVAIRNVQWSNFQPPTLGSGCGFVKESETDREWAELKLKRDSVKKALGV
jgi:menaquinone-specific isochorismate synthase